MRSARLRCACPHLLHYKIPQYSNTRCASTLKVHQTLIVCCCCSEAQELQGRFLQMSTLLPSSRTTKSCYQMPIVQGGSACLSIQPCIAPEHTESSLQQSVCCAGILNKEICGSFCITLSRRHSACWPVPWLMPFVGSICLLARAHVCVAMLSTKQTWEAMQGCQHDACLVLPCRSG